MERWVRMGLFILLIGAVVIPLGGRWLGHANAATEVRGQMRTREAGLPPC